MRAQAVAAQHPSSTSGEVVALVIFVVIFVAIVGVIAVVDVRRKRALGAAGETADAHESWRRQARARFRRRARFDVTLDAEGADADGAVVTIDADPTLELRVFVGLISDAVAGETTMTVLVPRRCDAHWVGPGSTDDPEPTDELLADGEEQVWASALTKVLPQVPRRRRLVATMTVTVPVPPRGDGPARIPLRFRAFTESLGVGEDPVVDRVFSVTRA